VEVYYPYDSSRQTLRADPAAVEAMVDELGLIPTGGSDDHGPGSVKDSIGSVRVPYSVVYRLRSLSGAVT